MFFNGCDWKISIVSADWQFVFYFFSFFYYFLFDSLKTFIFTIIRLSTERTMSTSTIPLHTVLPKLDPGFYNVCMIRRAKLADNNDPAYTTHPIYIHQVWGTSHIVFLSSFLNSNLTARNILPPEWNDGNWVRVDDCYCEDVIEALAGRRRTYIDDYDHS